MVREAVVKKEGDKRLLVIDYKGANITPDVAEHAVCMRDVIENLQVNEADEVVLVEYYERIYNEEQTRMLKGVADVITKFENENVWSPSRLGTTKDAKVISERHDRVLEIFNVLHSDPVTAYFRTLRLLKEQTAAVQVSMDQGDDKVFLSTVVFIKNSLDSLLLIRKMKDYVSQLGSIPEGRLVYRGLFESGIKPSFIGSRILFTGTETLELVDEYMVGRSKVYIYKHPERIEFLYYINPPEYTLSPEKYFLLEKTKEVVSERRPGDVGFMDMDQARKYFSKIYVNTISDIASRNKISISMEEREELAVIVARYTIGYGVLEVILSDRQLTDVYIDSPLGVKPIYLVHSKYGQCQTNVIFSEEEAKALVSRFRALSGRPFDEAHPILDFDLPDLQTRVAVIGKPLALDGIAFALRLHKETPWTIPQFLDFRMFNTITSGILSFFVDAQASMLIVGSRGSGKTSLLQALMQEIPQNLRIIVQEDSVTSDAQIIVERNGVVENTTVGGLVDGLMLKYGCEEFFGMQVLSVNPENVRVFSYNPFNGKIETKLVGQFTRHLVSKPIYEVMTRSGKKIKVTADHSLFTIGDTGIEPIKTSKLKVGDFIATPRRNTLKENFKIVFSVSDKLEKGFFVGGELRQWIRINRGKVSESARFFGYNKSIVRHWLACGLLPIHVFKTLGIPFELEEKLSFKIDGKSKPIQNGFEVDEDIASFVGLWLADGCYDSKYAVIVSVVDEESRAVVRRVAEKFNLETRVHSDKVSLIISNTNFNWLCKNVLELSGDAYTKRIPQWVWNSNNKIRASVLRGLFSGDGNVTKSEVQIGLCSKQLIKDVETLLLSFGVYSRVYDIPRDKTLRLCVSALKMQRAFRDSIGFIPLYKKRKLDVLCGKKSTHDSSDVIPFSSGVKEFVCAELGLNGSDYIKRGFNVGREKLVSVIAERGGESVSLAQAMSVAEVYWDEVKSVRLVEVENAGCFVYDFSVPECENFVCENIIAHNTQELPVPQLKSLGFNIERLKTRPPLGAQSEAEVSAEDALRTALRLGDSVLVVGEVRSTEARALYEAMRVGAVGNVVMGTIHGESAYSIWDRVVNDLGVPTTSFKATDFSIVGAPIRFGGSLKRERRIIEITEVKKEWNVDPLKEGGFLTWELFNANSDNLEFFEEQIKGSEWIAKVMRNRGLSYADVWNEISARAATKQFLVDLKRKNNVPQILEAAYSIRAHSKYLLMQEKQREEHGGIDYKTLLSEWEEWVTQNLLREVATSKSLS
jgi:type IV secretory pathway ATPase VirB11/archaellum biosynthesis ATPase/intein/homing endonuclease